MIKALLFFMMFYVGVCAADRPFTLVFSESYAPLSWQVDGEMRGVMIDVLNEALAQKMKLKTDYQGYPWIRAKKLVKTNFADAFVTVPTKARLEYTECSREPVLTVEVKLYTYVDHPRLEELSKVETYDDLRDFTIIEYLGNGWAKEKFKHLEVLWAPNLEQTYKMLVAKRGDVLVRNSYNFHYLFNKLNIEDGIAELPVVFNSVDCHLCIGKSSTYKAVLPRFDAVISDMRASGALKEISSRYLY